MPREIKLNGGEITVLKTLGLSGTQLHGKLFLERVSSMETAEFLETLIGLIDSGYVLATKVNTRTVEDVERSFFRVNPSYARDLKEALHPAGARDTRRARRDRRG
ncbi:MAG: hypothetical protein H0T11_08825 [Chthoniobacterales bacterium]|nr:hypothetical protein [Chthoniobacterales bacterium]